MMSLAERIWEAGTRAWYEHEDGSDNRTEALAAISRVLAEHDAKRDAAERELVEYLCGLVKVEDGNTEVNEEYFEVSFLGAEIWSGGGPRPATSQVAKRQAGEFRKRLRAALAAYREVQR